MKLRLCILDSAITLGEAKELLPNFSDAGRLPERTTSIDLGVTGPINQWRTDFLFDYNVFPASIMRHEAQWKTEGRRMQICDVILQRAVVPPIGFGVCLEFAVRISSIIEEERRRGFGYETLAGHAERGVSEFYFEERDRSLAFTIHTYSEPGHWTSRIAKNLVTLPYQAWCTGRALKHVHTRFHQSNGMPS
jgi:uncharacterized protein (UPF0548 family)